MLVLVWVAHVLDDDDGAGLGVNVAPRVVGQVLNGAQPAGCARKVGAAWLRAYSLAQPPGWPRSA